ncbi:uncharacterized protein LOC130511370 [Raphanus sativus]|uniref:Uncharacterized protein LOC130511370 n=1 Tax=Raphanus sativus TaxID=3726 RepID=A0A9W3DKT7_RAPSA|nr:uncharacterized protein LOC130511370 [Raphanus sativus]
MAPSSPATSKDSSRRSSDHYENPYYLHSNDHAGLTLVSDRLTTSSDFHSWRRSVRMALNVRNKLGFIDGTIAKPPSMHRDYGAWSCCNDLVATWLMNFVSKKIGQSLLFISTAEGIWNNLISRFKQDDAPRIYDLEQRLSKIEQGSLDVSAYYIELVTLWEEHRNFVELPVCTCGKCECDAAALWEKIQHRSRVTKFLMGLNESYEQTRRHILMLKPIPTIEEAFNIVAQDERQRTLRPATAVDNVAFQTSVAPQSTLVADQAYVAAYNAGRAYQKPVCTHCGKIGHTVQKCFKLHGFPPGYRSYGSKNASSQPKPAASSPQVTAPVSNAVASVCVDKDTCSYSSVPTALPQLTSGGMNMNLQSFTPQQLQHLIAQFNSHVRASENQVPSSSHSLPRATITEHGHMDPSSSSGTIPFPSINLTVQNQILCYQNHSLSTLPSLVPHDSWIIDSGASSHVCSSIDMFDSFVSVSSVTVTLPNDSKVPITHVGTIKITDSLILYDVLLVPDFCFNLISVSSLIRTLTCAAHFFPNGCLIQDLSQGLMIGKGSLYNNLYILDTDHPVASKETLLCGMVSPDSFIWHQHLGHPSSSVFQKISTSLPSFKRVSSELSPCSICPLAKQKRLAYVSHNNLASAPFDLVHLDIWGPFSVESVEGYRYFLTLVDDCFKGYKVLDLESHSVIISRNVVFKEQVFPFKTSNLLSKSVDMFPNTILPLSVPLHFVESHPFSFDNDSSTSDHHPSVSPVVPASVSTSSSAS